MKTNASIACTLLLTAALAGCFAGSGEVDDLDTTDDANSLPGAPPTASIAVWVEGNESMPENGSYAVSVGMNITFDASSSSGEGNLTYAWDFGDGNQSGTIPVGAGSGSNGTGSAGNSTGNSTGGNSSASPTNSTLLLGLPTANLGFQPNQTNATTNSTSNSTGAPSDTADGSVVTYVYGAEGNFTVTLYVTDDADQTTTETVEMTVTPGGPAPGTVIGTKHKKFTKSETCAVTDQVLNTKKTSTFEWVFNATEDDGTPSVVQNVTIKGGSGTTITFAGPDGKDIKNNGTATAYAADGPFEAGKYKITVSSACATTGGARNHNLDAYSTHVAV